MQSGKKKREEIQQKYMEKFKVSGVGKQKCYTKSCKYMYFFVE